MQSENTLPSLPASTSRLTRERYPEITFKEFASLMAKRGRSVDDLVDLFRGKLEDTRSFFERVLACQWRNPETGRFDARGDVVIPFESVIAFYLQELGYWNASKAEETARAEKRKRGPVSAERREALRLQLAKARALKVRESQKSAISTRENIEEVY